MSAITAVFEQTYDPAVGYAWTLSHNKKGIPKDAFLFSEI